MEKSRKTLREYSIVLIILGILDLINLATTSLTSYFDGSIDKTLEQESADIASLAKIGLVVVLVIGVIVTICQLAIAFKGLKVSKKPDASKGYITGAKIFFVISIIGAVSIIANLFSSSNLISDIISALSTIADVIIYAVFIKAAKAVRNSIVK